MVAALFIVIICVAVILICIPPKNQPARPEPQTVQSPAPQKPELNWENHKVAGISFRNDAVMDLAIPDNDYEYTKKELIDNFLTDERVYQYYFNISTVELIPEPDNPEDPNAIKVVFDDHHIGYIKRGSCSRIKKLLTGNQIKQLKGELEGGKYKYVHEIDDGKYELEKDEAPFFATVRIAIEQEEEGGTP